MKVKRCASEIHHIYFILKQIISSKSLEQHIFKQYIINKNTRDIKVRKSFENRRSHIPLSKEYLTKEFSKAIFKVYPILCIKCAVSMFD